MSISSTLRCLLPLAFAAGIGQASTLYVLNLSDGHGTGPFGQVLTTQIDAQTVQIDVTLAAGNGFVDTGAGNAFGFNLPGAPAINVTNITTGFVFAGPVSFSFMGDFDYSLDCAQSQSNPNGCGNGGGGAIPGPLSFRVSLVSGNPLSEADFKTGSSNGYFFGADIISGTTFNVGTKDPGTTTGVPEPSSVGMVLTGLAALVIIGRPFIRRVRRPYRSA
jgi:hypothetical protein